MSLDEEEEEDTDIFYFYLWDSNLDIYTIYDTVRNFLGEGLLLASCQPSLLALIAEKNLPIQETLNLITYIHAGYANKLQEK